MAKQKHPFDVVAEKLEKAAGKPVAAQEASPDFWELSCAADEDVVGDYPQAVFVKRPDWDASGGLNSDGFPAVPIPEQVLQKSARWTDVLSSNIWNEGQLFNDKALAVFKNCNLGNYREYPAVVRDHHGSPRTLTYLHIRNLVPPTAIDFARSEFYLTDMVSQPQGAVTITSFEDWADKSTRARKGQLDGCEKFSRIALKKVLLLPGQQPSADIFKLDRLAITIYISKRLKEAIEAAGISGLEIKPNRRLFAT